MNPRLFLAAITAYLLSLVATIVGSFFSKFIPNKFIAALTVLHVTALCGWFAAKSNVDTVFHPGTSNYLFLAFCSSGILASGIVLRKNYPSLVKVYFALFLVTVPAFLIAPSRLLGFIASGNPGAVSPKRFHLQDNLYLVALPGKEPGEIYKLVREMGIFHKTLARHVQLPIAADSVHMLRIFGVDSVRLRIYVHTPGADSSDLNVRFDQQQDAEGTITRKIDKRP